MQALANNKQITSPLFLKSSLFDLLIEKIKINILDYFSQGGAKISDYFDSVDNDNDLKKIVESEEQIIILKQNRKKLENIIQIYEQQYDIYMPNFWASRIEKINITLHDLIKHNYIDKQILDIIDTQNTNEINQAFIAQIIGNAHLIEEKFHHLPDINIKQKIYQTIIDATSRNTKKFNKWLHDDIITRQKTILPNRKKDILLLKK